MRHWIAILGVLIIMRAPVAAQTPAAGTQTRPAELTEAEKTNLLRKQWIEALQTVATKHGLKVDDIRLSEGQDDARKKAYAEALQALAKDPDMAPFFAVDENLVREHVRETDRVWVERLIAAGAAQKEAKSVNATSTNPVAPKSAERSGFTDLVALALDSQNFLAADKSAVSLNLNALALVGLNSETVSAQAAYRRYDALRRLGGTFTFGAKIPEGEITGLTGLPSAATILDVMAWDAKVRIVGDRDPRARRWYPEMLGWLGGLNEIAASLIEMLPAGEDRLVQQVIADQNSFLRQESARIREELVNSLQISIKVAGQHLTKEKGKNKYTIALLGDQGFGDTDLTFNLLYSVVDDVSVDDVTMGADGVFAVKTWSGAVGLNTLVAKNALVQGRATELSLNGKFDIPTDTAAAPIERKTVWNVVGSISLPWGDAAKIPVAVTFTNDPNNLKKEKFVTGYIGVSYDFGALKSLFKP